MDTRDPTDRYGHFTERAELFPDDRLIGEHLAAERYAREAGKEHGLWLTILVIFAVTLGTLCIVGAVNALEEQERRFQQEARV